MKRTVWTLLYVATLLFAVSLTSCRDDDGPFADKAVLTDIAVVMESADGAARFAVQKGEDTPSATLIVPSLTLNDKEFPVGDRLLLSYHYSDPTTPAYSSGEVSVDGIAKINNDVLRIDPIDAHPNWDKTPIYLYSIWRTGCYINVNSRLTYSTTTRTFMLMVDKATVDDEVPELYLVHDIKDAPDNFTRHNYASFDISALWNRPTCKGVNINVASTNNPQKSFTFNKPL